MAKSGDKRILAQNKARKQTLQIIVALGNIIFITIRLFLRRSSVASWHFWAFGLSDLLEFLCYGAIAAALAPHYSPSGDIVYPGADLNKTGGALSYYHDIIYISCFCHVVGAAFDVAWYVMALIPLYAGFKLFSLLGGSLFSGGGSNGAFDAIETEADRKRREKRERQAARAEKFAARRR